MVSLSFYVVEISANLAACRYTIGAQTYGGVALDEVVFTVEDGVATVMAPRAWRTVLNKAES